jgi:putative transcriptional regulator
MNLKNQLLIALPDMQDTRFKQAVILVCKHNSDGAMGLVINHPIEGIDTHQVFNGLGLSEPNENLQVLDGGPVNKNTGFILHNDNLRFKSSVNLTNSLTLTTSKDLLEKISTHQLSSSWHFILGYSGWDKDQLESEMAQNTWLTCPINLDLIFNTPSQEKWQKALSLIGINDYKTISGIAHA